MTPFLSTVSTSRYARIVLLMVFLCCTGCAVHPDTPEEYLRIQNIEKPSGDTLHVCTGFSCTLSEKVHLDPVFWERVGDILAKATTPYEERTSVAEVVGLFEEVAGNLAGFKHDMAKNLRNKMSRQLDCVAETVNTTVFLLALEERGLLRFHDVDKPAHRGTLIFYAHNTATIRERTSGQRYAVDSWFHVNGHPAEVVPLELWLSGWNPPMVIGCGPEKI